MSPGWETVAVLAAQPVMLAVALATPLLLAAGGRGAAGRCWFLLVAGSLGLVLALKLLGALAAQSGLDPWLRSPSGHVAAGTLVWGGVALAAGLARRAAFALALALVALLAPARVLGGAHSWPEAAAGAAIGLGGLALLARRLPPPPPGWRRGPLLLGVLLATALAVPFRLQPEPMLQALAAALLARLR